MTRSSCSSAQEYHLVLSGHERVPYIQRLEDLFVVNAGTVSSLRLRGNAETLLDLHRDERIVRFKFGRHPFHGEERIIYFSIETFEYAKYTGR